jgi:hypothetical protein
LQIQNVPVGDILNPKSLNHPIDRLLSADLDRILLNLKFRPDIFELFVLLHFNSVVDLNMIFDQLLLHSEIVLLHGKFDLVAEFIMLLLHALLGLFNFVFALELNAFDFSSEHTGDVALFLNIALLGLGPLLLLARPFIRV